jgi:hypothetical protein
MHKISSETKADALRVLTTAFKDNSGVLWVVKKDKKIKSRVVELCNYCLSVSMQKKGAYITSDHKGVALLFKSWKKQTFVNWLFGYIRLGQYCISWSRAIKIIKREAEIQRRRPKKKHLYFWMLGVEDHANGLNTIIEIRDFVYGLSRKTQLPIYAETTVLKMLTLYKRYGFKVYDQWETGDEGITVYFIYRDWNA